MTSQGIKLEYCKKLNKCVQSLRKQINIEVRITTNN